VNQQELRARARELEREVVKCSEAFENGRIEFKRYKGMIDRCHREYQDIDATLKNFQDGMSRIAAAEDAAFGTPAYYGNKMVGAEPPWQDAAGAWSGANRKNAHLYGQYGLAPATLADPLDMTEEQLNQMYQMSRNKTPGAIEVVPNPQSIRNKGMGGFRGDVQTKTAGGPALESGITGTPFSGQLPPIQTLFAVGLAYEPVAASSLLPGAAMPGPSSVFMTHVSNTNEPTGAPENSEKVSLGPAFSETQVQPEMIAATVEYSVQALQDTSAYGPASFAAFLPHELTASLINANSYAIWGASTSGTNPLGGDYPVSYAFNGLLNQSGTLTRTAADGASNINTLRLAINDLRVGAAKADADLIIMSPTTWTSTRGELDLNNRFQMDLLAWPLTGTVYGQPRIAAPADEPIPYSAELPGSPGLSGQLFGVPVAVTTQFPDGVAVVCSIARGAAVYFVRQAMRIEWNMWAETLWQYNLMSFRAENRISFATLRPSAVNIVSDLLTS
jgi:hypothetical protein